MKNLKRLVVIFMVFIMVFTLAACGGGDKGSSTGGAATGGSSASSGDPSAVETVVEVPEDWVKLDYSYATSLSTDNPSQQVVDALQAALNEVMPGMITITTYPNGTLIAQADAFDGLLNGTADIVYGQFDYWKERFPVSQITSYPSISFNSAGVATRVYHEFVLQNQLEEFADCVFLFGNCGGPHAIFSKQEITTLDQLKGKQIVSVGTIADAVRAYGATPVSLDITEWYEGLRNNMVDGVFTMYGAGAFANMQEVTDYALVTPYSNNTFAWLMNKDSFAKMPPSQQEAFMKARDMAFESTAVSYQEDALAIPQLTTCAQGMKQISFVEPGSDLYNEMKNYGEPLLDEYVESLEAKGIPARDYVEQLKALADKYNQDFTWEDYKACYPDEPSVKK